MRSSGWQIVSPPAGRPETLQVMSVMPSALPLLIVTMLGAVFLWGSFLAFRGRRWWATWMLLLGSALQILSSVLLMVGVVMLVHFVSTFSHGGGPSPTPVHDVFLMGGIALFGVGALLFTAGFVGLCARFGPTEKRAAELEGMLHDLQERVNGPS